jgi:hypothetical protein
MMLLNNSIIIVYKTTNLLLPNLGAFNFIFRAFLCAIKTIKRVKSWNRHIFIILMNLVFLFVFVYKVEVGSIGETPGLYS